MIAAHYDSIPQSGNAPGAEDNGSGVAGMLLSAKHAIQAGRPRCTIVFGAFTGEEEGLYGSQHFAKSLVKNDQLCARGAGTRCHLSAKNCLGAIILDEIAYTHSPGSARTAIFESAAKSSIARTKSDNWGSEQGRMFDVFRLAQQYALSLLRSKLNL
jgi:Zn-dependent M28 family amino/carboxypeptidase